MGLYLAELKNQGAQSQMVNIHVRGMVEENKPRLQEGNLLVDTNSVRGFLLTRQHFQATAVVTVVGFAVGLQIHFYAASYTAPTGKQNSPDKQLEWDKIATFDENTEAESSAKVNVVVEALKSKLAREVRNLARKNNEMT